MEKEELIEKRQKIIRKKRKEENIPCKSFINKS